MGEEVIDEETKYLLEHKVHEALEEALTKVLRTRPANPVDVIANTLLEYPAADEQLQKTLRRIRAAKELYPKNRAIKHFSFDYFYSLSKDMQTRLLKIIKSGVDNLDSGMGCYAMAPLDYDDFRPFFSKVLSDYHGVPPEQKHITSWSLDGVEGLPPGGRLDLAALGLPALSMRVRVGRNLSDFPLPGLMTSEQRIEMENRMTAAFDALIAMPEFGGRYYSLTPGHKAHMDEAQYKQLVDDHIMFKDMADDPYLSSAGISSAWPVGRGCYVSADKGFIVWVGEEDHLRIMCMLKGTVLNDVFDRLRKALTVVEGLPGLQFARSEFYGYVTSCPTNIGTGMRASVHIALPKLTAGGSDKRAKEVCAPLKLSVRGLGGEHTPIGADGTVDISPQARFCISEAQIITALYKGLKQLKERENAA